MGKTTKSKDEYTIDECVNRFSKLKVVLEITREKKFTDYNKQMLSDFFMSFSYSRCSDQMCKNLAYFVKYDLDSFHDRFIRLRKVNTNSKEWHIIQMGPVGEQVYIKKYIDNPHMREKPPGYRSSKSAIKLFKEIDNILLVLNLKTRPIYYDGDTMRNEYRIRDSFNKWFSYDYTVKELAIIIEYNGEHCHPNKNMSAESWKTWKHTFTKENADTVYMKDRYKQMLAEAQGYKYFTIWHSEYMNNPLESLEKIKSAISNTPFTEYIPKTRRTYILTLPDNTEIKSKNIKSLSVQYNLSIYSLKYVCAGKKDSHNGYKIRKVYELI